MNKQIVIEKKKKKKTFILIYDKFRFTENDRVFIEGNLSHLNHNCSRILFHIYRRLKFTIDLIIVHNFIHIESNANTTKKK